MLLGWGGYHICCVDWMWINYARGNTEWDLYFRSKATSTYHHHPYHSLLFFETSSDTVLILIIRGRVLARQAAQTLYGYLIHGLILFSFLFPIFNFHTPILLLYPTFWPLFAYKNLLPTCFTTGLYPILVLALKINDLYHLLSVSPRSLRAWVISFGLIVTRFAWIAARFTSSNNMTRNDSAASCNASIARLCHRMSGLHNFFFGDPGIFLWPILKKATLESADQQTSDNVWSPGGQQCLAYNGVVFLPMPPQPPLAVQGFSLHACYC